MYFEYNAEYQCIAVYILSRRNNMFSLIITVQSIACIATLESVFSKLKSYQQDNVKTLHCDDDYSIPSLIWPPPSIHSFLFNLTRHNNLTYSIFYTFPFTTRSTAIADSVLTQPHENDSNLLEVK